METFNVLLLGNSLLVDGLSLMLTSHPQICVSGTASSVEESLALIARNDIDGMIVMETGREMFEPVCSIIERYPYLTIIRANISTNAMQLITTETIDATPDRLLAVLTDLPGRRRGSIR